MIFDEKRPEMQRERERDFLKRENVPTHLSIHGNGKENVGDDRIEQSHVAGFGLGHIEWSGEKSFEEHDAT